MDWEWINFRYFGTKSAELFVRVGLVAVSLWVSIDPGGGFALQTPAPTNTPHPTRHLQLFRATALFLLKIIYFLMFEMKAWKCFSDHESWSRRFKTVSGQFFSNKNCYQKSIASTIFGFSKTSTRVISTDSIEIIMSLLNKILFLWSVDFRLS